METPESLLEIAAQLQTQFWQALSDLEDALGVDVDGTLDLENETIEHLRELAKEADDAEN